MAKMKGKGFYIVSMLVILTILSGCISKGDEKEIDHLDPLKEKINYIQNNISFKAIPEFKEYYRYEQINITLHLKNQAFRNISLNNFNFENIFVDIRTEASYYREFNCPETLYLSSRNKNSISNHTWNGSLVKSILKNNDELILNISLRDLVVFINSSRFEMNWMKIDEFINEYMEYSYIQTYMNITFSFIPTEDISFIIKSNPVNISLRWRPRYKMDIKRNFNDEYEKKGLEIAEYLDYYNLTKHEQKVMNITKYIKNQNLANFTSESEWNYYHYSNFISNCLINQSIQSYEIILNSGEFSYHYSLKYSASAYRLLEVNISEKYINLTYDNRRITLGYFENISEIEQIPWVCYYFNERYFDNRTLNDKEYICEMSFSESTQKGPKAGSEFSVEQYVILSETYEPVYIIAYCSWGSWDL